MQRATLGITRIHASSVEVYDLGGGALEVDYTGPMPLDNFTWLRKHVMKMAANSGAVVIRLDRMLLLVPLPYVERAPELVMKSPPGAFVVPPEQADSWRNYCRELSELGVMRAVFLPCQLELARQWAQRHAVVRL